MKTGFAKINVGSKITKNTPYKILDETDKEYQVKTNDGLKMFFPKQLFSGKQRYVGQKEDYVNSIKPIAVGIKNTYVCSTDTAKESKDFVSVFNMEKDGPILVKSPDDYSKSIDSFMDNLASIEEHFQKSETKKDIESLRDYLKESMVENTLEDIMKTAIKDSDCTNDGGKTDYYQFKENWVQAQDVIEDRNMNFSQGNIFKAAFTFNVGRHDGTDYQRELKKIIFFANRELKRLENGQK
jgi:hypothetical protein